MAEMNRFLLFVDEYLSDHNCQVRTDFIKSFASLREAQEFYDTELRETSYTAEIAEYDGIDLAVIRVTPGNSTAEVEAESGWVYYPYGERL